MTKILNCKEIAESIKEEIKQKIYDEKISPNLTVILVGNDVASQVYVNKKQKVCEEIGIISNVIRLPYESTEEDLLSLIETLNKAKLINGILVQLPLPKHINQDKIIEAISPEKDVDCFNSYNKGLIDSQFKIFEPCTPLGCIEILKRNNIEIEGKHCVIVGRSDIVGKPLSRMLINENATVTLCHSKTKNLQDIIKLADILIVAIGKSKFIKKEMIKDGVVILDVGINRDENKNLCGDVDLDDVLDKVKYITPVPNGVGLLTVCMLMKNCVNGYLKQVGGFYDYKM